MFTTGSSPTQRAAQLIALRITEYLSSGGLFNPELMDHEAVRDLLIDCRAELGVSLSIEEARDAYNAALNFALDEIDDLYEKAAFLNAWREGDTSEWPEFRTSGGAK